MAFLALRAINKICQETENFPWLLSILGVHFVLFFFSIFFFYKKVNDSTVFELLKYERNTGK